MEVTNMSKEIEKNDLIEDINKKFEMLKETNDARLEQEKKKKSGKENAFHIEELPNANGIYDKETWVKPDIGCMDMICSIAAGPESFIIGRMRFGQ